VNKIINDLTEKHNREMENLTNELEILRQTINDIKIEKKRK
jgi:polyhydroxyalkanoate synthesis regulator phasin